MSPTEYDAPIAVKFDPKNENDTQKSALFYFSRYFF